MWAQIIWVLTLATICLTDEELPNGPPGIRRIVSTGVTSKGYRIVYGDEDWSVINEVVREEDKHASNKVKLNDVMPPPLASQDVKCLMSVDKYCSKDMLNIKSVLVQSIKEDCANCSPEDKERAGKVIASMITHDPVAWKHFLTRSALQIKKIEQRPKSKPLKFRTVGEPEEVMRSADESYVMPGVKVRVKS